jgi:uncharacterized membrane protein YecN with MAPEG domain
MGPTIVPVYGALLAVIFILLSVVAIRTRRALEIPIGDSGDERMLRAMRVHANFAEYVPLTIFLAYMLEAQQAHPGVVHGICLCLVLGRLMHAFGVRAVKENYRYRVTGMALTFTALGASALGLLWLLLVM